MAGGESAGLPRSTVFVSVGAIALSGVLALIIVTWSDKRTQAATLRDEIADLEPTLAEKRQELASLERQRDVLRSQTDLFARGKLCVSNHKPNDPVTIQKLAVVYLDETGHFQTFNSEAYGDDLWTIPAGHRRQPLSYSRGGWDGSVTYYAMWIEAEDKEGPRAGEWPIDPEYCLQLPWPRPGNASQ